MMPPQFQASAPRPVPGNVQVIPQQRYWGGFFNMLPGLIQSAAAIKGLVDGNPQEELIRAQAQNTRAQATTSLMEQLRRIPDAERRQAFIDAHKEELAGVMADAPDYRTVGTDAAYRDFQTAAGMGGAASAPQQPVEPMQQAPQVAPDESQNPWPGIPPAPEGSVQQQQQQPPYQQAQSFDSAVPGEQDPWAMQQQQIDAVAQATGVTRDKVAVYGERPYLKAGEVDKSNPSHAPAAALPIPPKGPEDTQIKSLSQMAVPEIPDQIKRAQAAYRARYFYDVVEGKSPPDPGHMFVGALNDELAKRWHEEQAAKLGVFDPKQVNMKYTGFFQAMMTQDPAKMAPADRELLNQLQAEVMQLPPTVLKWHYDNAAGMAKTRISMDQLRMMDDQFKQTYKLQERQTAVQESQIGIEAFRAETGRQQVGVQAAESQSLIGLRSAQAAAEPLKAKAAQSNAEANKTKAEAELKKAGVEEKLWQEGGLKYQEAVANINLDNANTELRKIEAAKTELEAQGLGESKALKKAEITLQIRKLELEAKELEKGNMLKPEHIVQLVVNSTSDVRSLRNERADLERQMSGLVKELDEPKRALLQKALSGNKLAPQEMSTLSQGDKTIEAQINRLREQASDITSKIQSVEASAAKYQNILFNPDGSTKPQAGGVDTSQIQQALGDLQKELNYGPGEKYNPTFVEQYNPGMGMPDAGSFLRGGQQTNAPVGPPAPTTPAPVQAQIKVPATLQKAYDDLRRQAPDMTPEQFMKIVEQRRQGR